MAGKAVKGFAGVALAIVVALAALVAMRLLSPSPVEEQNPGVRAVAVAVAPIERGAIERRRTFSGSLQPAYRLRVAPKVSGQIETLAVDLADVVERGQVVATLDRDEFEQLAAQARADLAVAEANRTEARSAAEITRREYERVAELHEQGIVSDSEYDSARAEFLASEAGLEVARAQVRRAEAALESAMIRVGYTVIRAEWTQGDDTRVVGERFLEEGDAVSEGQTILSIVQLDPIEAVFFAGETEYAQLAPGQEVEIATDAFRQRRWTGRIARVAPVFREGSRQAQVEVEVPNEDGALKPGMFARIDAVLEREEDAVIVPREAVTRRNGEPVVFVVVGEGERVELRPLRIGLESRTSVQALNLEPGGLVVTLGQQLLENGSSITIPVEQEPGVADGAIEP